MSKAGHPTRITPTPEREPWERAVMRWTSGKKLSLFKSTSKMLTTPTGRPTAKLPPTLLIHARSMDNLCAQPPAATVSLLQSLSTKFSDSLGTTTCDQAGCDFNSWRMGNETFYGPGLTVDSNKVFTVVTQFVTDTGTASGTLSAINRFYVQGGKVIPNSYTTFTGIDKTNAITENFCKQQKSVFGDKDTFDTMGGLAKMGKAFSEGMVLVMSIWDDYAANCLWLDSDYPTTANPSSPGVNRGPCSTSSGAPATVEAQSPGSKVTFSNIKYGDLNSTFSATGTSSGSGGSGSGSPPASSPTSGSGSGSGSTGTAAKYAQCGGTGWTGATACAAGSKCTVLNAYYSQCL